jgi:hypothetical protein
VDALARRMPVRLFREWYAYSELEPFGGARDDHRAAMVVCAVLNSAFGRSKGARTFVPADVFRSLKDDEPAKPMTADAMERVAMAITARMGGKISRRAGSTG